MINFVDELDLNDLISDVNQNLYVMKEKFLNLCPWWFMALLIAFVTTACADSEMEKKLDGTWRFSQTETEDGVTTKMTETITYNASDHTMNASINLKVISPVHIDMATISYSGTWKATSDKVIAEVDENSVRFDFSDILDSSDRAEMRSEFKSGMTEGDYIDGGAILSISEDSFRLKDEEDGSIYNYTRVR